jgi:hypothetical protein
MTSALLVDPFPQSLAHLEVRELFLSDLDDLSSLRIPTLVAAVVFNFEATEPAYFYPVSVLKRLTNRVKHEVHRTARVLDRQSLMLRQALDKLTSVHILSPEEIPQSIRFRRTTGLTDRWVSVPKVSPFFVAEDSPTCQRLIVIITQDNYQMSQGSPPPQMPELWGHPGIRLAYNWAGRTLATLIGTSHFQYTLEARDELPEMTGERRLYPRVKMRWPTTLFTRQWSLDGITRNVSIDGAFLYYNQPDPQTLPLRADERVDVVFNVPGDRQIRVRARIAWSDVLAIEERSTLMGIGLQFSDVSDKDRAFLRGAITTKTV